MKKYTQVEHVMVLDALKHIEVAEAHIVTQIRSMEKYLVCDTQVEYDAARKSASDATEKRRQTEVQENINDKKKRTERAEKIDRLRGQLKRYHNSGFLGMFKCERLRLTEEEMGLISWDSTHWGYERVRRFQPGLLPEEDTTHYIKEREMAIISIELSTGRIITVLDNTKK